MVPPVQEIQVGASLQLTVVQAEAHLVSLEQTPITRRLIAKPDPEERNPPEEDPAQAEDIHLLQLQLSDSARMALQIPQMESRAEVVAVDSMVAVRALMPAAAAAAVLDTSDLYRQQL